MTTKRMTQTPVSGVRKLEVLVNSQGGELLRR